MEVYTLGKLHGGFGASRGLKFSKSICRVFLRNNKAEKLQFLN